MNQDKIREWVENKLEAGVEPSKIEDALEDHGYNPALVEELSRNREEDTKLEVIEEKSKSEDSRSEETDTEEENSEEQQEERSSTDENEEIGEDLQPPSKQTKEIAGELEKSISEQKNHRKLKLLAVAGILLIGGITIVSITVPQLSNSNDVETSDPVNTSQKVELPPGFQGEKVVLEDGTAKPSRPSLDSNEKVAFVNRNSYVLEISFDGQKQNLTVKPMNYSTEGFGSTAYYTGYPTGEGKVVKGSVYVS